MTETYYPSELHNGGSLTGTEYERAATDLYTDDGVIGSPSNLPLVYADDSGRHVKFRANVAVSVRGGRWSSDAIVLRDVAANDSGSVRVDLATIRLDRSADDEPGASPHVTTGSGALAPPPVQNAPGAGLWDFASAEITVRPGATSIEPGDVKPVAPYVGRRSLLVNNAKALPTTAPFGQIYHQLDTGQVWKGTGTGLVLLHQNTGWDSSADAVAVAEKWDVPDGGYGLQLDAVDRQANLVCQVRRVGAQLGGSSPSVVAKVGSAFRPSAALPAGYPFVFITAGGTGWGSVKANGDVQITDYNLFISNGQSIILTANWPIG